MSVLERLGVHFSPPGSLANPEGEREVGPMYPARWCEYAHHVHHGAEYTWVYEGDSLVLGKGRVVCRECGKKLAKQGELVYNTRKERL